MLFTVQETPHTFTGFALKLLFGRASEVLLDMAKEAWGSSYHSVTIPVSSGTHSINKVLHMHMQKAQTSQKRRLVLSFLSSCSGPRKPAVMQVALTL